MTTNNIVSTPNVTGNIGSCTNNVEKVITRQGFFREHGYNLITNSCTGEVTRVEYLGTGLGWGLIVIIVFFSFLKWLSN